MNNHEEQQQLLIPEKIKVGYKKDQSTYTGNLAYVIYYDHKGVLRKEKSWQGWRTKNLGSHDYNNEPTEGFVLNRGVGGTRESYGWNTRNEYIRVYDPRGFEIEISVSNLLFILKEGACSPGKGLEGKFVYAWDGQNLVLLPASSQDYQSCRKYTDLQSKKIAAKELVDGAVYLTKKQETIVYLGKFDYHFMVEPSHEWNRIHERYDSLPVNKADAKGFYKLHVFWDGKNFLYKKSVDFLAVRSGDEIAEDYAKLVDKYNKTPHASKVVRLFLKEVPKSKDNLDCWYADENNSFISYGYSTNYEWRGNKRIQNKKIVKNYQFSLENGVFLKRMLYKEADASIKPTKLQLFAETENGNEFNVDNRTNRYRTSFEKDI
jgi:hypothetical protein